MATLEQKRETVDYGQLAKQVASFKFRRVSYPGRQRARQFPKDLKSQSYDTSGVGPGSSELTIPINAFSFGQEKYLLRNEEVLVVNRTKEGFNAELESLHDDKFVGKGDSEESAKSNLFQKIHRAFQQLYKTHRMQRDNERHAIWQQLEQLIDVESYKCNRLTVLKCFGQLVEIGEEKVLFEWFGGDTLELPSECLIGGWGTLNEGDWCDAVVSRRAGDSKILSATLLGKSKPPTEITDQQSTVKWEALPSVDLNPID